eukprot:TRINITY_DN29274_c0_g1_i1.p1 TRINITY_DN29274_c0_g1~~TRINITY_DN29274_c0_g1_i1.p1  ORF type:complete len:546 (-),score=137.41 TRINITY_DN29274_c0_g1_i1:198-1835(-)
MPLGAALAKAQQRRVSKDSSISGTSSVQKDNVFGTMTPANIEKKQKKAAESVGKVVGALLSSKKFLGETGAFVDLYCNEFDLAHGRTLTHWSIYQLFLEMVDVLTQELSNPTAYRNSMDALNVLDECFWLDGWCDSLKKLQDFCKYEAFEDRMVKRRLEEISGKAARIGRIGDVSNLHLHSYLDEAEKAWKHRSMDGWKVVIQEDNLEVRQLDRRTFGGGLRMMVSIIVEISPRCLALMLQHMDESWWEEPGTPESVTQWKVREKIDLGPWDKIFACSFGEPYEVQEGQKPVVTDAIIPVRVTTFEGYPEPGCYSYVFAPFDMMRNVRRGQMGPLKFKTGVIRPVSTEPWHSRLVMLESMTLPCQAGSATENLFHKTINKMIERVERFKQTSFHAEWAKVDEEELLRDDSPQHQGRDSVTSAWSHPDSANSIDSFGMANGMYNLAEVMGMTIGGGASKPSSNSPRGSSEEPTTAAKTPEEDGAAEEEASDAAEPKPVRGALSSPKTRKDRSASRSSVQFAEQPEVESFEVGASIRRKAKETRGSA